MSTRAKILKKVLCFELLFTIFYLPMFGECKGAHNHFDMKGFLYYLEKFMWVHLSLAGAALFFYLIYLMLGMDE